MNRGFYTIMAAQFFSSLADNALLIAAIALLRDLGAPGKLEPLLKFYFFLSYVLLAAFVGAFADSMAKGRVMFVTNTIKVVGCLFMLFGGHPFLAYTVVGIGAAAYSPAKYGILTELLPPQKLVIANGWIEGLTVGSIILGFVVGGILVAPRIAARLLQIDVPYIDTGIDHPAEAAIAFIIGVYALAAIINLFIPDTGARYPKQERTPWRLVLDFGHCVATLWRDKLGQISLAVTTMFWGAGATLQFIVLKWAESELGLTLSQGAILQAVVAIGIALGAVLAAARVSLRRSLSVLPLGVIMGVVVATIAVLNPQNIAGAVTIAGQSVAYAALAAGAAMMVIGALAGYFVVPMNALLQHRGHVLLSAGHSIAVQNFNENLSILLMLAMYYALLGLNLRINTIILLFGAFVATVMGLIMLRHRMNQRLFDSEALIPDVTT